MGSTGGGRAVPRPEAAGAGRRSHLSPETQVAVWREPRERGGDLGRRTWGLATRQLSCYHRRLRGSDPRRRQSTVSLSLSGGPGQVRRAGGARCRGDTFGFLSLPRGLSVSIASVHLPRAGRHLSLTVSPSLADSPLFSPRYVPPLPVPRRNRWGRGLRLSPRDPVAVGPRALPTVASEAGGGRRAPEAGIPFRAPRTSSSPSFLPSCHFGWD